MKFKITIERQHTIHDLFEREIEAATQVDAEHIAEAIAAAADHSAPTDLRRSYCCIDNDSAFHVTDVQVLNVAS